MIGSEGSLGIITSAVVKLFPLPEERRYGSLLFRTFEEGFAFMYELAQEDRPRPACGWWTTCSSSSARR
jgi:FAD/FMN-containing dehydrogenase